MALAHLFVQLKKDIDFKLSLAHVNYGLRGAESGAQEKLVRDFASQNNLACFVTQVEKRCQALLGPPPNYRRTSPPQKEPGTFSQAMARDFRYHYFEETALQIGAAKVAVAHHLEDQVETILAQWLRGSSLRGLGGMRVERGISRQSSVVSRQLKLIRPLLTFSKEDLKKYAYENKVSSIEDSSNASPKYWRNRVRHGLLPVIQDLRPQAFEKIVHVGEELGELADFVEKLSKDWLAEFGKRGEKSFWIPRPRFVTLPKTVRLEILHQAFLFVSGNGKNLKRDHLSRCDQLSLGNKSEGYYNLPGRTKFVRLGDDLIYQIS